MNLLLLNLLLLLNFFVFPQPEGSIEIIVEDISSDTGVIQLLIFDQEEGWPESVQKAWKALSIPIQHGRAEMLIPEVPEGEYAITIFHDEDEDGEIRKNKVGYPLDEFGFSNNPSLIFGVPAFSKCSKKVNSRSNTRFKIELR